MGEDALVDAHIVVDTAYICGKFTLPTAILFSPINLL
jgi:hypothetical protein